MSLQFERCSYSYASRLPAVVSNLDFSVPRGRTLLLGPNGAGKSTILKLAAAVIQPKRGLVVTDGISSARPRHYRKIVSYTPQHVEAVPAATARQQVALRGWLKGLSKADAWDSSAVALDAVNLTPQASMKVSRLSGGQQARVGLASALVHDASVLLLDEPTASLDPDQREEFLKLVETIAEGRTVVVSSHDVSEIGASYDNVAVVVDGTLTFSGSTNGFLDGGGGVVLKPVDAYRLHTLR